jgi:hypothetical protein
MSETNEAVASVILGVVLVLSEVLPFITNLKGNGITHALLTVAASLIEFYAERKASVAVVVTTS